MCSRLPKSDKTLEGPWLAKKKKIKLFTFKIRHSSTFGFCFSQCQIITAPRFQSASNKTLCSLMSSLWELAEADTSFSSGKGNLRDSWCYQPCLVDQTPGSTQQYSTFWSESYLFSTSELQEMTAEKCKLFLPFTSRSWARQHLRLSRLQGIKLKSPVHVPH